MLLLCSFAGLALFLLCSVLEHGRLYTFADGFYIGTFSSSFNLLFVCLLRELRELPSQCKAAEAGAGNKSCGQESSGSESGV